MEIKEIEAIKSNYIKLEDIKNSCESLMQKIGQLQVDLFNNPDKDLEKFLGKLNADLSSQFQIISEVFTNYENDKYYPASGFDTYDSTQEGEEETTE